MTKSLLDIIEQHYKESDYPALKYQIEKWSIDKPLEGLTILDATPVFRNTLAKYVALLVAGADLTVGISNEVPCDKAIVKKLREMDVKIVKAEEGNYSFDIIIDCAASFSKAKAKIGYVELTRSGVDKYKDCNKPVFVADSGKIKRIETSLGTGESYFRAMASLGYTQWKGKKLVVCGSGKVGKGIITYGLHYGAEVIVVTDPNTISNHDVEVIDYKERHSVTNAINSAYAVVTATGVKDALLGIMIGDCPILANMGIEDEFGETTPQERVLNNKSAINFMLDEPTHLKYIDATMALHNMGALYLSQNRNLEPSLITPPSEIEDELLEMTRTYGTISKELTSL